MGFEITNFSFLPILSFSLSIFALGIMIQIAGNQDKQTKIIENQTKIIEKQSTELHEFLEGKKERANNYLAIQCHSLVASLRNCQRITKEEGRLNSFMHVLTAMIKLKEFRFAFNDGLSGEQIEKLGTITDLFFEDFDTVNVMNPKNFRKDALDWYINFVDNIEKTTSKYQS